MLGKDNCAQAIYECSDRSVKVISAKKYNRLSAHREKLSISVIWSDSASDTYTLLTKKGRLIEEEMNRCHLQLSP